MVLVSDNYKPYSPKLSTGSQHHFVTKTHIEIHFRVESNHPDSMTDGTRNMKPHAEQIWLDETHVRAVSSADFNSQNQTLI